MRIKKSRDRKNHEHNSVVPYTADDAKDLAQEFKGQTNNSVCGQVCNIILNENLIHVHVPPFLPPTCSALAAHAPNRFSSALHGPFSVRLPAHLAALSVFALTASMQVV